MFKRSGVKKRIAVIGGVPEPSGGVTVFNGDLVEMLSDQGHEVIVFDQNAGKKQERFSAVQLRVWQGRSALGFHVWVSASLLFLRVDQIILHTSNTSGLIRLIIPMLQGRRCFVFFHNGDVELKDTSALTRIFLRWMLGLVDHSFVMSHKQLATLTKLGYPVKRVSKVIPVIRQLIDQKNEAKPLAQRPFVIIACGYETRIYNFEFAIRVAQELPTSEVHLYLYGAQSDPGYLDELLAIDVNNKLCIFRNEDRKTFLHALQNSRLFVRPNHVDSYGVSVLDALLMGTPVVASDVCERAAGAFLFSAGDYDAFKVAVDSALSIEVQTFTKFDMLNANVELIISVLEAD
jgi:glycosyltransferase involved in cell wall biosynthesis